MKDSERSGVTGTLSPSSKAAATAVSGTLKDSRGTSPQPGGLPIRGDEVAGTTAGAPGNASAGEDSASSFSYRNPMDNIVIRTFQFPMR